MKCGEKIRYNAFKKIKGVIYCLKCKPEERISKKLADTVSEAKVTFDELQSVMKNVTVVTDRPKPDSNIIVTLGESPKKKSKKRSKRKVKK